MTSKPLEQQDSIMSGTYTSLHSFVIYFINYYNSIPIGYWSIPVTSADTNTSTSIEPFIPGAWKYLLQALTWAQTHSIYVIVDLHGAPGSQNGYDNSGQRTSNPIWGVTPFNITRTIDTLVVLATNVGGMIDVIELVNEPAGFLGSDWADAIKQFWLDGYKAVRQAAGAGIKIMIGDAFLTVDVCCFIFYNLCFPPLIYIIILELDEFLDSSSWRRCIDGFCRFFSMT